MEQHPIPRQITTFEFKLIGFMTLKQFLYLIVALPGAFVVFKLVPIPLINILMAIIVAGAGAGLAFVPIQDRPADVWIKNLYKRLTSPTQYTYQKSNHVLYFLQNLYFVSDPHKVMAQVETKEKLAAYLASVAPKPQANTNQKQQIHQLLQKPTAQLGAQPHPQPVAVSQPAAQMQQLVVPQAMPQPQVVSQQPGFVPMQAQPAPLQGAPIIPQPQAPTMPVAPPLPSAPAATPATPSRPFFVGVVKNNRRIALPGVLVYIKDLQNNPLRLLKSNPHGIFATFNPLPAGDYLIEAKDAKGGYFFDTMKIRIENENPHAFEIYSKEML